MKINNIEISGENVANAIMANYPKGYVNLDYIYKNNLYNYLVLFGIRITTCASSMPDDVIGGIRLRKPFFGSTFGQNPYFEIICSEGSTDPSPFWLMNPMSDAAQYGGTAWVKEGQYLYGKGGDYHGYPSFRPLAPISVYRWKPTQQQINDAKAKKLELSSEFEIAKAQGLVTIGTSDSVLIHRTWSQKLYKDSAGCQVFGDNGALQTLYGWAGEHIKIYQKNSFVYTLLTKDQFTSVNNPDLTTIGKITKLITNLQTM